MLDSNEALRYPFLISYNGVTLQPDCFRVDYIRFSLEDFRTTLGINLIQKVRGFTKEDYLETERISSRDDQRLIDEIFFPPKPRGLWARITQLFRSQ